MGSVLHPCDFFSKKLSPVDQNYDIGNRELLAIKLALEEWRHWLEGANHPFEVITDYKSLQYLREAKLLNPIQAQWALFFTRFNFTVTYSPGHKNTKADALSRIHSPDPVPEPLLPPDLFVRPIACSLNDDIRAPPSPGGPEEHMYPHIHTNFPSGLSTWSPDPVSQADSEPSHTSKEAIGGSTWLRTSPDL